MKKHFTKPQFAAALLKFIDGAPSCVLDPAAGDGALLHAAFGRWPNANIVGFEISRRVLEKAKTKLPRARLSCVDALHTSWRLQRNGSTLPLVVCNPPFLGESHLPVKERVDIQFFDRCLTFLKGNGALLFVFPQSIASNPSVRELRSNWLRNHTLRVAIGLPQNAFQNTEASAVAVIVTPGKPTGSNLVRFVVLGRNAQIVKQARDRIESSFRFDPNYYILRNWIPKIRSDLVPLRQITQDLRRGIFVRDMSTRRSKNTHSYIHSTNLGWGWISEQNGNLVGPNTPTNVDNGCVLLSRVGKGLWKKFALYTATDAGTASDCLYILRTSNLVASGYLVAILTTRFMQLSIRRTTRGIAVPILNKKELLDLPIPWLPSEERHEIGAAWLRTKTNIQRAALTASLNSRLSQEAVTKGN